MKTDRVIVTWYDASAQPSLEDHTYESAANVTPCINKTLGYVIRNEELYLVMGAESDYEDTSWRHTYTIPKINIISVHFLDIGKKIKKYDLKIPKRKKR